MAKFLQVIIVLIVTICLGCSNQTGDNAKINTTSGVVDTPRSLVKNYGVNDTTRLFAFVGEKISVDELPSKPRSFDHSFKAKYVILKEVFGSFPQDTIEFVAYDHYGVPAFSKFKNVLLFVSADSGTYYHIKYMYNDVYKTKEGRWAGMYSSEDYEHPYNKHTKIKPEKIEFAEKLAFSIKAMDEKGHEVELPYPKQYFKTVGDSAFANYGNYVEDLFTLKRGGPLTAYGLFKATAQQEEDKVEAFQPEPRKTPPTRDDLKFLSFWQVFVASLNEPGLKMFRQISLDTLSVCDKILPVNRFIEKCFNEVIDAEVRKRIVDKTKLEYTFNSVEFNNLLTSQVKKEIIKVGDGYRLRKMLVTRSTKDNNPPTIYFGFIETKRGYRLYEIGHHWFKDCCK